MSGYLAKLGDFTFTIQKTSLDALRHSQTFAFAKQERLLDHPHHQPTGQWEDSFQITGTLHLQKLQELESLQTLAQAKKPIIFVTGYGKIFGKVIIESLEIQQAVFLKNGEFLKQSFTLRLQKIYD